jgi:hypothetical protein
LQFFNGDALRETFTHTEVVGSVFFTVIADVHLCTLILVFTYVVANCTVALVEEAFFKCVTAHTALIDLPRDDHLVVITDWCLGFAAR